MVQREIGWRDMFSFTGSMTPLTGTEAHLADSIAATKGPNECSDHTAQLGPVSWR